MILTSSGKILTKFLVNSKQIDDERLFPKTFVHLGVKVTLDRTEDEKIIMKLDDKLMINYKFLHVNFSKCRLFSFGSR